MTTKCFRAERQNLSASHQPANSDPLYVANGPIDPQHEHTPKTLRKDPNFWYEDGNICFKIGAGRFANLHISVLTRHSGFFESVLRSLDATKSNLLESVRVEPKLDDGDFKQLLRIIYPPVFSVEIEMTAEEWGVILRASTRFKFKAIRQLAIGQLASKATPLNKVLLGRDFNVPKLLFKGYASFCKRKDPLTDEEGEKLGPKDIVRIKRARHEIRLGGRSKDSEDVDTVVRDIFGVRYPPAKKPRLQDGACG